MGREFFIPARILIATKLLTEVFRVVHMRFPSKRAHSAQHIE